MHPLVEDLTQLTDAELQERLTKINQVLRRTYNGDVVNQAVMIRATLQEEQNRRHKATLDNLNKNKFTDVIDIS
jgi:type IV secretory pathway VirB4 component